jgi:hypothetical protein
MTRTASPSPVIGNHQTVCVFGDGCGEADDRQAEHIDKVYDQDRGSDFSSPYAPAHHPDLGRVRLDVFQHLRAWFRPSLVSTGAGQMRPGMWTERVKSGCGLPWSTEITFQPAIW